MAVVYRKIPTVALLTSVSILLTVNASMIVSQLAFLLSGSELFINFKNEMIISFLQKISLDHFSFWFFHFNVLHVLLFPAHPNIRLSSGLSFFVKKNGLVSKVVKKNSYEEESI